MTIEYDVLHAPVGIESTIIVLPGVPGSRRVRLAEGELERVQARVVMTERPGFGATPFEPGRTLADHVGQIAQLADELGIERFAVLGWSGGGSYALACGASLPSRVAVVGLASAHVSTFDRPEADDAVSAHHQMIVKGMREDPVGTQEAVTAFMQPQADAYSADPSGFKDRWMAENAIAWGRKEIAGFWLDVIDDVIAKPPSHLGLEYAVINGPLGFDLAEVHVPVRSFHGTHDTNVPIAGMRDLVSRLPDATLVEWEGETHFFTPARMGVVLRELATFV